MTQSSQSFPSTLVAVSGENGAINAIGVATAE
jgi:hypothetical protein